MRDGGVAGCWLVDRFGLLRIDRPRKEPPSVRWDARRGDGVMRVVRTMRADGGVPTERWTPWQGRKGGDGEATKVVSMQRLLWLVETARVILGASSWPVDETDVAAHLVHVDSAPAGETREDLDARARADLASALAAIDPFLSSLDARAVALALRGAIPREDRTLYWRVDRSCGAGDPLGAALDAVPEFGHGLLRRYHGSGRSISEVVRDGPEAVRAHVGRWMAPLGEQRIALTFRIADRLASLSAPDRAEVWRALAPLAQGDDDALHLSSLMGGLPPDWMPRDGAGWVALARCWPALDHARKWALGDAPAMLGSKGDWPGYLRRLDSAHGRGEDGLQGAVEDLLDMREAYAAEVLGPALHATHGHATGDVAGTYAPSLLQDGRRLCRILEASRRWHHGRHAILDVVRRHAPKGARREWPRAWPTAASDGVRVVELTSVEELRAEGSKGIDRDGVPGLSHCVGGHADRCMSGHARVLSLRRDGEGEGSRLSTAEVAWSGGRASVIQHRASRNATPGVEAARALSAYVEAIGKGKLTVDEAALAPVGGRGHGPDASYDHRAAGAWEEVRAAWDPFVPRRLRGASPDHLHALACAYADVPTLGGGIPWRGWLPVAPAPVATPVPLTQARGAR